jgi:hypothetical protein
VLASFFELFAGERLIGVIEFLIFLKKERQEWQETLNQRRHEYQVLVDNLISSHIGSEDESAEASDHVSFLHF